MHDCGNVYRVTIYWHTHYTKTGPLSAIRSGRNAIALSDAVMVALLKRQMTKELSIDDNK